MVDGAEAGCDVGGVTLKPDEQINRVIVCSGKVYFDLVEQRGQGRPRRRLHPAPGAVLSVAAEVADHRAEALQERRAGLVPGRAQEHGRLAPSSIRGWS